MSDEKTQNLPDARSFEERVFARFDALESQIGDLRDQIGGVDARLQALEAKSYDTKPIWERALAEILSLGEKMDDLGDKMHRLERKVMTLASDMLSLRSDQSRIEDRMDRVESKNAQ